MGEPINPDLIIIKNTKELDYNNNPHDLLAANSEGKLVKTDYAALKSAIVTDSKGEATPLSSPTPWAPGDADLYEKWDVKTAGTYVNFKDASNTALVVTTDPDLKNNFVQIWVKNGVSQKVLSLKPINVAQTVFDPNNDINPSTMKAAASRWDKTIQVLDSFVNAQKTEELEISMPLAGETSGAYLSTSAAQVPETDSANGIITMAELTGT
ncbi:hypothetical protein [Chryseobacterium indologenes]|uniref:Uncharacterized protein n=1 Tax=Chryseobacterium indologenes TaxID=253 RepID=A0A0N0IUP8_CHRID|nr:hypothetical protein [Chryseobacterium indologenes]KPE49772.1 hypothetical protein AOB46_18790 [Chryseobacterium indologenes]